MNKEQLINAIRKLVRFDIYCDYHGGEMRKHPYGDYVEFDELLFVLNIKEEDLKND